MTDALWPVEARVPVPGSKSLTARWLVLAAIAQGPSVLHGALESRDTRLMREALEALGARFDRTEDALQVRPLPAPSAEPAAPITIHTGLAGTVMRFVPLVAGLHHGDVTFTGDPSALRRPMGPVLAALRGLGVEVTELGEPGHLPLTVHGRGHLRGGRVEIDSSASSQFVSALLLVAARCDQDLEVVHVGTTLPSLPHIEMTRLETERAKVHGNHGIDEKGRHRWNVQAGPVHVGEVGIEPDLSNAGPFLAAAVVTGGTVAIPSWPRETTQPGDAYRGLLTRMGAEVRWGEDSDGGGTDLVLRGTGQVHGVDADLSAVGELTPTIAAVAALADGPSHLRGIGHLRGHETDRIHALATELAALGCGTVEHEDSLEIIPPSPHGLHGGVFESYEDHRMATAGAIIGLRVPDVQVVDVATTAKTLPDFVGMWERMLGASVPVLSPTTGR
jgi:3-phosphoshikimate 1-carboxyvinyltransferase